MDDNDILEHEIISDESLIDKMMLESYGIQIKDTDEAFMRTMNESLSSSLRKKLFGVDNMFVFNIEDTIEDITERNEMFAGYLEYEIYNKVDSCTALLLVDNKIDDIISKKLYKFIDKLDKGEVLRYDDFFRELLEDKFIITLLGDDISEEFRENIKSDDSRFEKMPHVVRIF